MKTTHNAIPAVSATPQALPHREGPTKKAIQFNEMAGPIRALKKAYKEGALPFPISEQVMALLTKADLAYQYSWTAIPPDDARVTGRPDSTLLNRNEGYEVLAFINRMAEASKWTAKAGGLKVERMIKAHLPGSTRSHKNVWQWIVDNWSSH